MNRYWAFFSALALSLVMLNPAQAFFGNARLSKAQDYMKAGMPAEAIKVLQEEIKENPLNAEAHYQLAIIHIDTCGNGCQGYIQDRMNSAIKIDPSYGPKFGKYYKSQGDTALARNDIGRAASDYQNAVKFDSSQASEIGTALKSRGDSNLSSDNIDNAVFAYEKAVQFNKALGNEIADACYKKMVYYLNPDLVGKVDAGNRAKRLGAFVMSIDRSSEAKVRQAQNDYANKCLDKGQALGRKNGKAYIQEASLFIGKDEVEKKVPSWVEVYRKTFVGVGNTGGDWPNTRNDGGLQATKMGEDILGGDRFTVIDCDFEVWRDGSWRKFQQGEWLTVGKIQNGLFQAFRNGEGKKFTIVVQRYVGD
jgi:tetratricopeptide (TPR) repeat protein